MKKKFLVAVSIILTAFNCFAQNQGGFMKPPKEILDLVNYKRAPSVIPTSDGSSMLFAYRETYERLEDMDLPELKLGGLRINHLAYVQSDETFFNDIELKDVKSGNILKIKNMPANAKIAGITLSPDEQKFAFINVTSIGVDLWIVDIATASATKLVDSKVNAVHDAPFAWMTDSKSLLVRMRVNSSADLKVGRRVVESPIIATSTGTSAQNRTFQDLLKNEEDEFNFEKLSTSELSFVSLDGTLRKFLSQDMYIETNISPDGQYVLVSTLKKPFSYFVPFYRFPSVSKIYKLDGALVAEVNNVPLNETQPKGFSSTRTGRRFLSWRPDKPSTLWFVEALDGGDQGKKADFRDEVFVLDFPYNSKPASVAKTKFRFSSIMWGDDKTALINEMWYDTRTVRTSLFNPSSPEQPLKVIIERNSQDKYSDPGRPKMVKNNFNRRVLYLENKSILLVGDGFSEKGQFPFIDKLNLETLSKVRLYQTSYTDKKEAISDILNPKEGKCLVRIESKSEYPNYYIRTVGKRQKGESLVKITDFQNPFKALDGVHKEVFKYKRKDGLDLSGTLYLPAGYDVNSGKKLPLLIWAYPEEFKDKASAGQVALNPNEFTFPSYGSFIYWVTLGYAVLDDASFPIVGEGDREPNDTFIDQLVANAEAAIDALDKVGYIDRKRVAVGGHSYGAFMTANLLTHSKLFACGIARSGAYNRTLTPFGFQNEQRNYWEAKEVYTAMSPFMNAEKMKTPLLLVHGEVDNNPGTFTLQTERYFQALKGLGAPVRMVILPKESHGYYAIENILHLLWEQNEFFKKHLMK